MGVEIRPWIPIHVAAFSLPGQRTPHALTEIGIALDPDHSPRYTPRDITGDRIPETFCNVYVWDFSLAAHCEIPHWIDAHGNPAPVGPPNRETAIGQGPWVSLVEWFTLQGPRFGWRKGDRASAIQYANAGKIAIPTYNPKGIGHIAVVMPQPPGAPPDSVWISQAGASCFALGRIERGFGTIRPDYWLHE